MGGNDRDFDRLYNRYYERTVAFLRRLGVEAPRDLAQDAFIRVFRSMASYRKEAEWGYIEQTARRLAVNSFRDRHARKRDENMTFPIDGVGPIVDRRGHSPEAEVIRRNETQRLYEGIRRLTAKHQEVLLHQLSGFSYEEIAQLVGISVEAVKSRLHEARNELRGVMEHP